ncbi:MAG: aminoacyl-tRNA hydrolase [Spirochaetaceae bacterium]
MVIIGLGNPGRKYEGTRHNVGFEAVELFAHKADIPLSKGLGKKYRAGEGRCCGSKAVCIEPYTFMNRCGDIVPVIIGKFQATADNIVVVCDNLDLPPGMCRIKHGGGNAGHNGLASLIQAYGTGSFLRVYVGIGRPQYKSAVVSHVLGAPEGEERTLLDEGVHKAADALYRLFQEPLEKVMNEFNRKNTVEQGEDVPS